MYETASQTTGRILKLRTSRFALKYGIKLGVYSRTRRKIDGAFFQNRNEREDIILRGLSFIYQDETYILSILNGAFLAGTKNISFQFLRL